MGFLVTLWAYSQWTRSFLAHKMQPSAQDLQIERDVLCSGVRSLGRESRRVSLKPDDLKHAVPRSPKKWIGFPID